MERRWNGAPCTRVLQSPQTRKVLKKLPVFSDRLPKSRRTIERRYTKLLANLERDEVFIKDLPVKWYCRNCGYVSEGKAAPEKCPVCDHLQSYFEMWVENY